MFCENCGNELSSDDSFCSACGMKIEHPQEATVGDLFADATDKILNAAGVESVKAFSFKELLSDALKRHTVEEREDHFLVGTSKTTPSLAKVKGEWPKPWMFIRCFVASVVLYFAFSLALDVFQNLKLIPGLVFLGTIAVPVSITVFFFELNVWKNISLFEIGRFIIAGGVVSLIIALVLFQIEGDRLSWLSAASAGLIEEPAKLATIVLVARGKNYQYKLNGLVLGAAVGAGFAIFESMGYSIEVLLETTINKRDLAEGLSDLRDVTLLRGLLSPFCHVVWTAIAGAALWRINKGAFEPSTLLNIKFLRLFAIPVLFHMLFNFSAEHSFWLYVVVPIEAILVWKIVISLANEGIDEVVLRKREKRKQLQIKNRVEAVN